MKRVASIALPCLVVLAACSLAACGPVPTGAAPELPIAAVEIPPASGTSEPTVRQEDPPEHRPPPRAMKQSPPAPSHAGEAEEAFAEARRLMNEGKFVEACPLFERSLKLDPAVGTMLNLASCAEKIGDTMRACAVLSDAASLAGRDGQAERARYAQAKMASLGCP